MRLGCFLPLLAIGFIAVGVQGVYIGMTNRTLSVMTYQEFLQKKPSSGWIEISDARLNLLSAINQSNRFTGTIKQVYIPVNSPAAFDGQGDGQIHLLLSTKDEAILKTMNDVRAATSDGGGLLGELKRRVEANSKREASAKAETKAPPPTSEADVQIAMRFLAQNVGKLIITRPVRGLIQFGLDSNHRDRAKIQALGPKIAPDFAVLEDEAQPEIAGSVFMVITGLGLTIFLIARASAKAATSAPRAPGSPGDSAPPAGPDSPLPVMPLA
jgi:hypothetical protein